MRILVFLLFLFIVQPTHADVRYIAKVDDVTVTLYDSPCKLGAVENLKRRATWTDKTGTTEGCWGGLQPVGIVLLYFADKTVTALPAQMFERASGA